MKITPLAKIARGQDGAIHAPFLFRFDTKGNGYVYRMEEILSAATPTEELPATCIFRLDRTELLCPHSNAVMFGNEYVQPEDEFPLLYTNVYNNYANMPDRREGVCAVYRILRNGDQFFSELMQVIAIGFTEDPTLWRSAPEQTDVRPYGNFTIDPEKGILYAFTMRDRCQTTRYFSFALPKLTDGSVDPQYGVRKVVLDREQILESFDCPYHHFLQGACFHRGQIYSVEGFTDSAEHPPVLRIVNPQQKKQVFAANLLQMGYRQEAEWIDFLGDRCFYSDCAGTVFTLDFS